MEKMKPPNQRPVPLRLHHLTMIEEAMRIGAKKAALNWLISIRRPCNPYRDPRSLPPFEKYHHDVIGESPDLSLFEESGITTKAEYGFYGKARCQIAKYIQLSDKTQIYLTSNGPDWIC